ncbi:MAG: DUF1284 domain-containing protein [Oscillospiraceae bacterium]|jgi:hypothetical protein|nr:DUF1284 domain-containing protein [Oscillospiraceae bacterium]
MRLRPHHLLCTQGYSGKGYNSEFVVNMTAITDLLRSGERVTVDIVFSTDDICGKCPNFVKEGVCKDNDKVNRFDKKVMAYFGIEERRYIYNDIIHDINSQMTPSMMDDICSECSWYPVSACKEKIAR